MKRQTVTAALVVVGLALLAAPANATTELRQPCPYQYAGHDDGVVVGCYDPATDTIFHDGRRLALWHERGHAFDHEKLTDTDRAWFADRFFGGLPWWYEDPLKDGAGEKFAHYFAACHMRAPRAPGGARAQAAIGYGLIAYTAKHRRFCNAVAVLRLVRG